jgi:hypothetical protein
MSSKNGIKQRRIRSYGYQHHEDRSMHGHVIFSDRTSFRIIQQLTVSCSSNRWETTTLLIIRRPNAPKFVWATLTAPNVEKLLIHSQRIMIPTSA